MKSTIRVVRNDGSQVGALLAPPKRVTDTDYRKLNYDNLRKQQEENKHRKDEISNRPPKEPFKIKRFKNVASVVLGSSENRRTRSVPSSGPQISQPMGGPKIVTYDAEYETPNPSRIPSKPRLDPEPSHAKALNPNYGKVPQYIDEYKEQRRVVQEEKARKEEQANCPAGMRLMPEDERVSTLDHLEKSKTEVFNNINKLPIASNTRAVQLRRQELESKLTEIESAIKIFSRPKVYVAI